MPAKGLPLQLHFCAIERNTGYMEFYIKLRACVFARSQLLWASVATLLLWIVASPGNAFPIILVLWQETGKGS